MAKSIEDSLEVIRNFVEMQFLDDCNKFKLTNVPKSDYTAIKMYLMGNGYNVDIVAEADLKDVLSHKNKFPNYTLVIMEDKEHA